MNSLSELSIFLLILHFLGDYHFQSEGLVQEKRQSFRGLLKHIGVHAGLLSPLIAMGSYEAMHTAQIIPGAAVYHVFLRWLGLYLAVLGSHFLLDFIKQKVERHKRKRSKHWAAGIYLVDQFLHVGVILLLSEWLLPLPWLLANQVPREWLSWVLLGVLVTKPANVTFKMLFKRYRFYEIPEPQTLATKAQSKAQVGAGALIGNLERLISAIFLGTGQAAAIGLIYTAKSIARFKKIEENQGFAEYYLIGTLYSILYVTALFYILV